MKKKIVSLCLTAAMAITLMFGVTGCGGNESAEPSKPAVENATESTEATEEAAVAEDADTVAVEEDTDAVVDVDGVFSGQIKISGKSITFPCTASDLEKIGFSLENEDSEMDTNSFINVGLVENGEHDTNASTLIMNKEEKKQRKDCTLYGITFYDLSISDLDFELPNGITKGSTMEEVRAAFDGMEPSYDENDQLQYDLDLSKRYTNSIHFVFNDGVMTMMTAEYQESWN